MLGARMLPRSLLLFTTAFCLKVLMFQVWKLLSSYNMNSLVSVSPSVVLSDWVVKRKPLVLFVFLLMIRWVSLLLAKCRQLLILCSTRDNLQFLKSADELSEATERYRKAHELMLAKEMIANLPPPGSAMYRPFLDPKENPKPYSEQVKRIEKYDL